MWVRSNDHGVGDLSACTFELVVDDESTTLSLASGVLEQEIGRAAAPELTVRTTSRFLARWAAGDVDWDDGLSGGEVATEGSAEAWSHWLAATGCVLRYEPRNASVRDVAG